jgi:hypothetical protein
MGREYGRTNLDGVQNDERFRGGIGDWICVCMEDWGLGVGIRRREDGSGETRGSPNPTEREEEKRKRKDGSEIV